MTRRLALLLTAAPLAAARPVSLAAQGQAQTVDTTMRPPAPGPLRRYELPPARRVTLPNGLTIVTVERHGLPMVSATILVDAGAAAEPREKAGLASLAGTLLSEGTRTLRGAELAERLERLGAQYNTLAGYTSTRGMLSVLRPALPQALALAARTFIEPSFPDSEVARARSEALAADEQTKAEVSELASRLLARAVYAPEARLSLPIEGTKRTITGLTRDDVVRWHGTMFAPGNTTVLLVGDVTPGDARRIVEQAFGGWRAPTPARPAAAAPTQATGMRVVLVDRPGSVQSGLAIGGPSLAPADADYLRLLAFNRVLGGGFNARVNMNLREKHGYTYGAFSTLGVRRGTGLLAITSPVRTSATDSAVHEAIGEYRRTLAEPIPAPEFTGDVSNMVASFPSSMQTAQAVAGQLTNLLDWGMPLDFYATYRERLSALTPAEVQQAARARLKPDAIAVVVVGDLSKIEAPLRALNLGPVEVWDADGNRVR